MVPADDEGSVLILGIGAVSILITVLLVGVDVAGLAMRHHDAELTADAAARAAAQGLDLAAYYRGAGDTRLPLNEAAARWRAQRLMRPPWHVSRVAVVDDIVTVTVSGRVPLVVGGLVGHDSAAVVGSGSAALSRLP